jgi:UDP-2,3-diacylglucosamine hydrolase
MKQELLMPNGMPTTNPKHINLPPDKKAYFVSDHHFGLDGNISSFEREKMFVRWLNEHQNDAGALFILGDMFDYWYEYKQAVPKGYVRVLGKLAEWADAGIPVYFFAGNHDMWMLDYFEKEIGIQVYFQPEIFIINNRKFLLGHGDGLGPGDKNYKYLKKLFKNKIAQWAFRWLHPDMGLKLIKYLSQKNKLISGEYDQNFFGEKEWLFQYAKEYLKKQSDVDYFIFGHRHLPLKMAVNEKVTYYNTGDWLIHFTYLIFDNDKIIEEKFNA